MSAAQSGAMADGTGIQRSGSFKGIALTDDTGPKNKSGPDRHVRTYDIEMCEPWNLDFLCSTTDWHWTALLRVG
eukprot:767878-Hanusia_phi.AAC.10